MMLADCDRSLCSGRQQLSPHLYLHMLATARHSALQCNKNFVTVQVWSTYSPVKNNPADALAKVEAGGPSHSATTGELDVYQVNCRSLLAPTYTVAVMSRLEVLWSSCQYQV